MGQITLHEALALRWAELCADPRWHDLGGKLELNGMGVIEMSPASNRHGIRQAAIAYDLTVQLPHGSAIVECSVFTTDGVRVPDIAWASNSFLALHSDLAPFAGAPEICVEVRSPSNTDAEMAYKTRLLLEAGAHEVWIVSEAGDWQVFTNQGQQAATRFGVSLSPGAAPATPP